MYWMYTSRNTKLIITKTLTVTETEMTITKEFGGSVCERKEGVTV